ncbi:aliphatic sulfonate ABC transporter substrate-binding protein [Streptacidiphilus sp. PAMC 29251]
MSRTTSRLVVGAVSLLTVVGSLSGCASATKTAPLSGAGGSSAAAHPEWSQYTFTIGDNGGDGSEALAKITGAFATAPYKVKFARFTYGPPLVQAAASGDIDLGSVGDVPPITGAAKEYGFKIVAVTRSLTPTQPAENIIMPKGSPIQSLTDLRGKKLAVPQGSSAHGLALNALRSVGLTPKDVQLVFLDPAAGATAFATGKVDAWAIWNPQSALAVNQGARILAKGLPPIDQTSNYYVASDKSLSDPTKRAALTDLLQRLGGEFHWGVQHPDQYAQAISQEEGIPLADAKAVLTSLETRVTPVEPADITAEQQLGDAFLEAGQISKKVDVTTITDNLLPAGYDSSKVD